MHCSVLFKLLTAICLWNIFINSLVAHVLVIGQRMNLYAIVLFTKIQCEFCIRLHITIETIEQSISLFSVITLYFNIFQIYFSKRCLFGNSCQFEANVNSNVRFKLAQIIVLKTLLQDNETE